MNNQSRWSKSARKGQSHNPVKNKGKPGRKAAKKLSQRVADFAVMVNQSAAHFAGRSGPAKRMDSDGYHCPGSMQR